MQNKTVEYLNTVEQTVEKLKPPLCRHQYPDNSRTVILVGTIDQMLEHHSAILRLIRDGKVGSAFALARSVVESMYSGLWLNFCATDAQVTRFETRDDLPLTMAGIADAIDTKYKGDGFFADLKKRSWPALCGYAHNGMLQLGRRFTGHALQPSYRDEEIVEVTRTITTCIIILVGKFLAVQGFPDDCKEVEALVGTYNPT